MTRPLHRPPARAALATLPLALAVAVTAASLAMALATPLPAQQPVAADARDSEIRTTGFAQRQVRPDLATFVLQFSATGRTPADAGRTVAARADSIRRALARVGIPIDSLATRSQGWYHWRQRVEVVALQPRQVAIPDPLPGQNPLRMVYDTMYRVNDAIEVRTRDLARVGPAIDAALALRVTDISPISFRLTSQGAIRDELLAEATRHARRQAETIAQAAGGRLGRIILLSTEPLDDHYRNVDLVSLEASGAAAPESSPTLVAAPLATVRLIVHARWQILTP